MDLLDLLPRGQDGDALYHPRPRFRRSELTPSGGTRPAQASPAAAPGAPLREVA